jgi:hypothetical protein
LRCYGHVAARWSRYYLARGDVRAAWAQGREALQCSLAPSVLLEVAKVPFAGLLKGLLLRLRGNPAPAPRPLGA